MLNGLLYVRGQPEDYSRPTYLRSTVSAKLQPDNLPSDQYL
jgi:hypothetical protein